jgi:hypothetical protein
MAGFGWDYSGTVTSWRGGKLESVNGRLIVRLYPPSGAYTEEVTGDSDFSSSLPVLQRLNPIVYELIHEFEDSALRR